MLKVKFNITFFFSILILVLALVSSTGHFPASADTSDWLITPEEAAMQIKDGQMAMPVAAVEGPGPVVVVKNPKALKRLKSPVDILISFEPGKSGEQADMETLKVTLVGFIDINITDRLKEYIRGTRLEVEKAKLPSGKHRLRMHIQDVEGNPNERDIVVSILKPPKQAQQ